MESDPFAVMRTIDDRIALVRALRDEPLEKRDLIERLDCSRSTVNRAVRSLEELHLIRRRDSEYVLTFPGSALLAEYERCCSFARTVSENARTLTNIPVEHFPDGELFRDAEIICGTPPAPDRPRERFGELATGADQIYALVPSTNTDRVMELNHRVVKHDRPTEFVLESEVLEYWLSAHADTLHESLRSDQLTILLSNETFPYALALIENTESAIIVGVCDDSRRLCGLIISETEPALEWGRNVYQAYREKAQVLESLDDS